MSNEKTNNFKVNGHLLFIKEFLKHPLQIGSIIPSSRFLERRIVEAAGAASVDVIIELGPGTGGITRAILRAMPRHAKLLSIEINPHFNRLVSIIEDKRLIAHQGSAIEIKEAISRYDLDPPNAIVSGIPFSTMSHSAGSQIIEAVSSLLPPNGRFVAYQVNSQVAALCRPFLGSGQISMELLNIPPMRVFQWVKNA
ncbi:MAG: methyltransferase type 12 [Desulfobulbaceae bacterium BRH_c16a]|nr:MAG: methyltransferase type 12 [Desulfobulbaceae bacterium BRH_c16a]